jgi:hypothetical protein
MSISVNWGDQAKRYILVTYHGEWSWQDYQESYSTRYEMVRSVEHPVDVIVDVRLHPDPPGPDAARYLKWVWEARPANIGRTIMIGADTSGFMKNLVQIFVRLKGGGDKVIFVNSMEEALALINHP